MKNIKRIFSRINKALLIIPAILIVVIPIIISIFSNNYYGKEYVYKRNSIDVASDGTKTVVSLKTKYKLDDGVIKVSNYKNGVLQDNEIYLYAIDDEYLYIDFGTNDEYIIVGTIDAYSIKPVLDFDFQLINFKCEKAILIRTILWSVWAVSVVWLIIDIICALIKDKNKQRYEEITVSCESCNYYDNLKTNEKNDNESSELEKISKKPKFKTLDEYYEDKNK